MASLTNAYAEERFNVTGPVRDMRSTLLSLGIISDDDIEEFYPRVRDDASVKVMRCRKTGVLFLAGPFSNTKGHYRSISGFSYWDAETRENAVMSTARDDERRAAQFKAKITDRAWLDFGTGAGGILDRLCGTAREVYAVEPQPAARTSLIQGGYKVYEDISEAAPSSLDIVTLFHVLEHVDDPVSTLNEIRSRLVSGGEIVIEVPHARDFLISFLDLAAFKEFTFWSEHLVLHTRESLRRILGAAGYRNVEIIGFQRYPLENHLHWIMKSLPGGHTHWRHLGTPALEKAYAEMLEGQDMTDTLIATATT